MDGSPAVQVGHERKAIPTTRMIEILYRLERALSKQKKCTDVHTLAELGRSQPCRVCWCMIVLGEDICTVEWPDNGTVQRGFIHRRCFRHDQSVTPRVFDDEELLALFPVKPVSPVNREVHSADSVLSSKGGPRKRRRTPLQYRCKPRSLLRRR